MSDSDYLNERGTNLDTSEGRTNGDRDAWADRTNDGAESDRAERNDPTSDRAERNEPERDRANAAVDLGGPAATGPAGGLVSDPESLRRRWESVQVGFVDDPRQAVGDADGLVSLAIDELADGFRRQRQRLESRWSEGGDASTDDLRESFQRYRDFFERLLQV